MISEYHQMALKDVGAILEDIDDINQSIKIILETQKGEDPLRPEFGSEIYKYIDYPVNKAIPHIVREIINAINMWEPRINITNINTYTDGSHMKVAIEYKIKNTEENGIFEETIW